MKKILLGIFLIFTISTTVSAEEFDLKFEKLGDGMAMIISIAQKSVVVVVGVSTTIPSTQVSSQLLGAAAISEFKKMGYTLKAAESKIADLSGFAGEAKDLKDLFLFLTNAATTTFYFEK